MKLLVATDSSTSSSGECRSIVSMTTIRSVSVVIPAHNPRLEWLDDAVNSAVEQEPAPMEVLIVDDGSDIPVEVDHPLVRVIRQENSGVAAARNRGVSEAQGEYIALLDQDDIWLPGKLAAQLEMFEGTRVGLCSAAFEELRGEGLVPGWGGAPDSYRTLLRGNCIAASTVMLRRQTLLDVGGFPPDLAMVDDWDTWLRVLRVSQARHVATPLVRYRVHAANASRNYRAMFLGSVRVLWRHRAAFPIAGLRRVGQIYGAQAFDAFKEDRSPADFVWAMALWPDYMARQIRRQVLKVVRHRVT